MADDDIYGSKKLYEKFLSKLDNLSKKPKINGKTVYYCKNPVNKKYFEKLINHFEVKDLSYIRRMRYFQLLKIVCFLTKKDLIDCEREDINAMVRFSHTTHKTVNSKRDFVKDVKCTWRVLFPGKDSEGRIDETITPYTVRHLSRKVDKSKQKLRNDRLTWQEFQKLVQFFSNDIRIQAYLTLAFESLGRPQEILYTKIRDYEFQDSFARVWISEHGKEGTGVLQCIDSYPFVAEWFKRHPFKEEPDRYFFINIGNRNQYQQLKPKHINAKLKYACHALGIEKNITCYSLKRNGVTFRRQRGDTDMQIQHAARWTSTSQLKIYDMSTQQDAFDIELKKRGLVNGEDKKPTSEVKTCIFCSYSNGFTADFCTNCKRPLDREKVEQMAQAHERMMNNEMMQRLDKMERMFEGALRGKIARSN
jgi:integrase